MLVMCEAEMFQLASKSRQRKCTVFLKLSGRAFQAKADALNQLDQTDVT